MRKISYIPSQKQSPSAHCSRIQFLFELLVLSTRSSLEQNKAEFSSVLSDKNGNRPALEKDEGMTLDMVPDTALRQRLFDIAKAYTEDKGWSWFEPAEIIIIVSTDRVRIWRIRTNTDAQGNAVHILIAEDGTESNVVESRYIPQ